MPIYRLQTSVWFDSLAEHDAYMINPVVHDTGVTSNPTNLANDWLTLLETSFTPIQTTTRRRCKVYDCQGTKPVFPAAEVEVGTLAPASKCPRELALCLSFHDGLNRPKHRGRLYIPAAFFLTSNNADVRPTSGNQNDVAQIATGLAALGGVDVDWNIWSPTDHVGRKVAHWWIDDEWDIIRSRGRKPTSRLEANTSG